MQLKHFAPLIFIIGFAFFFLYEPVVLMMAAEKALKGLYSAVGNFLDNPSFLTFHILSDITCQRVVFILNYINLLKACLSINRITITPCLKLRGGISGSGSRPLYPMFLQEVVYIWFVTKRA